MSASVKTRAVAVAAVKAALDSWEPGQMNGVSISFDGERVKWMTWAADGKPITGTMEVEG